MAHITIPPDLLELLTDTIPALFKSKQAVIDFFQGAGAPAALLSSWRHQLRTDRDSVRKHEITRDVLRALNEAEIQLFPRDARSSSEFRSSRISPPVGRMTA
jgi:hypothetical protein